MLIPGTDTVEDAQLVHILSRCHCSKPDTLVPDGTFVCFNTNNVHTADGAPGADVRPEFLAWEANLNMGDRDW